MRFAGLKNIFEICLHLQLEAWWGDVIMTLKYPVECKYERKKYFWIRKTNQREVSVIYDHLDVYIRYDPAEIRGLVVVAPIQSQDFPIFQLRVGFFFSPCLWPRTPISGFSIEIKHLNNSKNKGKTLLGTPVEFSVRFCLVKHDRRKKQFVFSGWETHAKQKIIMKSMSGSISETR